MKGAARSRPLSRDPSVDQDVLALVVAAIALSVAASRP